MVTAKHCLQGESYTQQKIKENMFWACNTRTVIFHEMKTPCYYEVSFYLLNLGLFEMMTLAEPLQINVKVNWSPIHVSQNCHIIQFVYQWSLELFHTIAMSP